MARLPCAPREFSALPQELRELTGQWMSGSGTNTLDYVDCLFWMQRCRVRTSDLWPRQAIGTRNTVLGGSQ